MSTAQYPDNCKFTQDTLFIIVIYNCLITRSVAFQSFRREALSSSGLNIFIYDNSRLAQEVPLIDATIYYHHNPANAGVSAAYNEGFRKAKQLNKKWLLLADQDTEFPKEALKSYDKNIQWFPNMNVFTPLLIDKTKIISPFRFVLGKGVQLKTIQSGVYSFNQFKIINSGLLISVTLFESAGGYDERFPLDFSDLIFIERLSAISSEFVLTDTTLNHSLSSQSDINNNVQIVVDRFKQYCMAVKLFKKVSKEKVILTFVLLPRAMKLSWLKKDIRFLLVALNTLLTHQ